MKNFDFLYNTVICSYLLMKKLLVLLALPPFQLAGQPYAIASQHVAATQPYAMTGLKMAVTVVLWAHATGARRDPSPANSTCSRLTPSTVYKY